MDLERTTRLARAALENLERHRRRINALNVYPVPDGDTGTNLTLTVEHFVRVLDEAQRAPASSAPVSDASLRMMKGAKGNSGVILSTIVRGMAPLLDAAGGVLDGAFLAEALRAGSNAAYEEVQPPIEGTMLTVIREMAEEAERLDIALPVVVALARVVARGDEAVDRTPEMLEKLREAGVVDAGAVGLVELVRGVLHHLSGEPLPDVPEIVEELTDASIHQEDSKFRYCTSFVVEGEGLDLAGLRSRLVPLGDSLIVTGNTAVAKIHIHTDDPDRAVGVGRALGVVDVDFVEINDMHDQAHVRERWLAELRTASTAPATATAVIAVAQGGGNQEIFRSERTALVIEGGPTANPTVGDIQEAIAAVSSEHLILLPNDPNIRLAAEVAGRESTKDVRVLPTRSMAEGMALMIAFDPDLDVDRNETAMRIALEAVVSAEIITASRNVTIDGVDVAEGDFLGLISGRAYATGDDIWQVLDALVEHFSTDRRPVVRMLRGEGAPDAEEIVERYSDAPAGLELDVLWGGQPHYPLLLSAE